MAHQVVWVDIPATNIDRAIHFYSIILNGKIEKQEFPGMSIGTFPMGPNEVSGCVFQKEGEMPSSSDHGPLVYLNVNGRLDEILKKVVPNGGKILQPRQDISPYGFRAIILDSEGNRIALHSM